MFEEIDLKIDDDDSAPTAAFFTVYSRCAGCTTRTGSGGYGTSCKYCC